MRANSLLLIALLTVAGFGAGLIVGGRLISPRTPGGFSGSASYTVQTNRLPPVKHRPKTVGTGTATGHGQPASIAEIEATIQKAIRMGSGRIYKTLNDLVQKANPADIPELLAFIEKSIPANHRSQLRAMLLARWAESDVPVAMAYADKVSGYQDRQQAILAVLRAWAEQDAQAATAWAQQLPSGSLRKQALSAVTYELAQKNPEAAYGLMMGAGASDRRWGMTYEMFSAWAASDQPWREASAGEASP